MTFASIRYRSIKVAANTSKIFGAILLSLAPELRVKIPDSLAARRRREAGWKIPAILWQTNYTQQVTPQVYACLAFNRWMAPDYEYRFMNDANCDAFVEKNYPGDVWDCFRRLRVGAARADFWRLLVLLKHGGVYLDIDACFTAAPDRFMSKETEGVFIAMSDNSVSNYFIASAPGNPVLKEACDRIVSNILNASSDSVYSLTGPVVLDEVVKRRAVACIDYRKACVQGQFTNKRGQYIDRPDAYWQVAQAMSPIVAPDESASENQGSTGG